MSKVFHVDFATKQVQKVDVSPNSVPADAIGFMVSGNCCEEETSDFRPISNIFSHLDSIQRQEMNDFLISKIHSLSFFDISHFIEAGVLSEKAVEKALKIGESSDVY